MHLLKFGRYSLSTTSLFSGVNTYRSIPKRTLILIYFCEMKWLQYLRAAKCPHSFLWSMTSSASPEQCILTCWHASPEYKGELWHSFLMLRFRTPKMSITFNSMAVVVTGQHNNRRIWKRFHLLIRESQGLGLCGMELILCCFKGLKPFKLIAVGDEIHLENPVRQMWLDLLTKLVFL